MSDLRFLEELGAQFERIGATHAGARRSDRGRRRWMRAPRAVPAGVGLGLSVLVVVSVFAVRLGVHTPSRTGPPGPGRGVRIAFSATTLDPRSPLGPSIERSIAILRDRLGAVFRRVQVSRAGNGLVVLAPGARRADRARIVALAAPARLAFYDWEANALTSNGKTVASQLHSRDPNAVTFSQGGGSAVPGESGAGSRPLYDAVKLASRQAAAASKSNARDGREYFLFGAPGSAACATAAAQRRMTLVPSLHCLLSGPVDETRIEPQRVAQELAAGLPSGVTVAQGQELVIPQGTVVLQAAPASAAQQTSFTSPSGQFYVLKDQAALPGSEVTNPRQSTDPAGGPDVQCGFSSTGATEFQHVTSQIAHRSARRSAASVRYLTSTLRSRSTTS